MDAHGKMAPGDDSDDGEASARRRRILRSTCAVAMLFLLAGLAFREAAMNDDGDDNPPVDRSPAALMLEAARHDDAAGVRRALDAGVPVDVTDEVGQTPLVLAARCGDASLVQTLIARQANANHQTAVTTPLVEAADYGETGIVRQLLDAGADANLRTPLGQTPLIAAAAQGNEACVRLLLSRGADPSAVDHAGDNAAAAADMWQHTALAAELRAAAAARTSQHRAAIRLADNRDNAVKAVP